MNYRKEGEVAERPHLNLPKGTFEEELGLDGFYGPVAHLYHRNPPTSWSNIEKSKVQWKALSETSEEFLKPQCYKKVEDSAGGGFFESQVPLFFNDEICIHIHPLTKPTEQFFRNADASELLFCHEGGALLESPFGVLQVETGDYVSIPKGVSYRLKPKDRAYLMRIESFKDYFKKPETGILGQQALYHEEGIQSPLFSPDFEMEKQTTCLVQKEGKLTEISYDFDIRDIVGWCGTLYPFVLSVNDIAPAMSPIAHLPPSINSTFVAKDFIVCSFLPRPLEEPEGALKVPFYHSNIDYDEIIFYHAGDFFSRDNMGAGYITLHPRGINHGPHPKALKKQHEMKRTEEVAVMIDTIHSLKVTSYARELENVDYWKSWRT